MMENAGLARNQAANMAVIDIGLDSGGNEVGTDRWQVTMYWHQWRPELYCMDKSIHQGRRDPETKCNRWG